MNGRWGWALALGALGVLPHGDIKTREVEYRQGDTVLQGLVAWDDDWADKRPGVLVVHEWWGLNEYARRQARRLAEAGYVGFALDMFGNGRHTDHPQDAQAFASAVLKNPEVLQARFDAALAALKQDPHVDPDRIAAIGYCFGGTVVLRMARTGADLAAVVSFHGGVANTRPDHPVPIKARVLVLAGGADPIAPPAQVEAFRHEMEEAGADIEVVSYPGAKHSFTNPDAGQYGVDALAYDSAAAAQSWRAMLALFNEVWPR